MIVALQWVITAAEVETKVGHIPDKIGPHCNTMQGEKKAWMSMTRSRADRQHTYRKNNRRDMFVVCWERGGAIV